MECGWAKVKMRLPVDWPCLERQLFSLSHLLYLYYKQSKFLDSDNRCDLNSPVMEFVAVGGWPVANGRRRSELHCLEAELAWQKATGGRGAQCGEELSIYVLH